MLTRKQALVLSLLILELNGNGGEVDISGDYELEDKDDVIEELKALGYAASIFVENKDSKTDYDRFFVVVKITVEGYETYADQFSKDVDTDGEFDFISVNPNVEEV